MASGSVPELVGAERFNDVDLEPTGPLTRIEGYEKKPLVSLEEAVKRIKKKVYDIDGMVWLAKRALPIPEDVLTSDEYAAIFLYTMEWPTTHESIYIQLNRALRAEVRDGLRPWFSYLKLILTALYKLPSIKGIVWRGICGDLSEDYKKDYIWWGFSSCTTRMEIMKQFIRSSGVRTIFMIECVHGKSISNYSQHKIENEILLMPGTFLRVVDKCKLTKGLHMIHLQETNAPHQLIAPPFNSPAPVSQTLSPTNLSGSNEDESNDQPVSGFESSTSNTCLFPTESESKGESAPVVKTRSLNKLLSSNKNQPKSQLPLDTGTSVLNNSSTCSNNQSGDQLPLAHPNQKISVGNKTSPISKKGVTTQSLIDRGYLACQCRADKKWLDPQYHDETNSKIKKPNELENEMDEPNGSINEQMLDRIQGSIIGMALGDALGAHVEFRPHQFLVDKPVTDMESGGTWGLQKGQFTDDTSMALCLANSLIANRGFNLYDQLVRYKWWYKLGYMSSTGQCFDIGAPTRQSIQEFESRQKKWAKNLNIPFEQMDYLSDPKVLEQFNVYCSEDEVAGNGALMRLAPVPLFFYRNPTEAVELSGQSGQITHGDKKAYDACRYYGALIVAALHDYKKEQLLDDNFYSTHKQWFGKNELHPDIESIAKGSYKKKNGYDDGIRGKGYIVNALEAALWAFWSDENSFEKGALAAVNLGDDTDTTAAIYGQLAGAHYGYKKLPAHWLKHVYAKTFMEKLNKWIAYEGECYQNRYDASVSQ